MENSIPRFPNTALPEKLKVIWDAVWGDPENSLTEREHYDSVVRLLKLKLYLETAWMLWNMSYMPKGATHATFVPVDPDQASYPKWNAIISLEERVLELEKYLKISPNVLGENMDDPEKYGLSLQMTNPKKEKAGRRWFGES